MVAGMREQYLLGPYSAERDENPLAEPAKLLAEASALYEAVYTAQDHMGRAAMDSAGGDEDAPQYPYHVAFAWHMAGDLLLHIRKARLCRERTPSLALFTTNCGRS